MRSIILVCFLLAAVFSSAQNVAGIWRGRFQNTNPLLQQLPYQYELLIFQTGDSLTGYSYSTAGDKTFYAICTITGKVFDGYMVAKEVKTIYQTPDGGEGALQTHILFFGSNNTEVTGEWKQNNPRKFQLLIEEGTTVLKKENDPAKSDILKILQKEKMIVIEPQTKKDSVAAALPPLNPVVTTRINEDSVKLAARKKEILKTIEINSDSVLIELFDDSIVDGDTVSVFINNTLLLNKVSLTSKGLKQKIYVSNNSEGTLISMYAENEGSIPPNTGLLIIRERGLKQEVRFTSSGKKTAAVLLKRK